MGSSNQEAIREVGRSFDIVKQLQGIYFHPKSRTAEDAVHTHELAEPLFREALQSLHHALSVMKSSGGGSKVEIKSETNIAVLESGSPVHSSHDSVASYDSNQRIDTGRGKRKRVDENTWSGNTTMPYVDGFQWRKYGDKKISGSNSTRSYFRCTYKEEQGCQAKKIVQETTITDRGSPLFEVTYTNNHTCNFKKSTCASSSQQPSPFCSIEQDTGINEMSHMMKPQMLEQDTAGCLIDANNQREILPFATQRVEGNFDWDMDMDPLLMEYLLIGFTSDYSHLC